MPQSSRKPSASRAKRAAKLKSCARPKKPWPACRLSIPTCGPAWARKRNPPSATADFDGYQVNEALFSQAAPDAVFMHCLPAHRGLEVSEGVIDSPRSIVYDQAENRLHVQKAVLHTLLT